MVPPLLVLCFMFSLTWLSLIYGHPEQKLLLEEQMDSLMQYVTKKAAKHQVMFLIDENNSDQKLTINDFVKKINSNVPILINSTQLTENTRPSTKHTGQNPRATTLFIIIVHSEEESEFYSRLEDPIALLSKLSNHNARPKCLIVHFVQNRNLQYELILKQLWEEKFLDVTILEVRESEFSTDNGFLIDKKRLFYLHRFNPYSKMYSNEKRWGISQWFPDKGRNFYNYELKILTNKIRKREVKFVKILSEKLNFSMNGFKAEGLVGEIVTNIKGHFSPVLQLYDHSDIRKDWHTSRVFYLDVVNILVPEIPEVESIVSWKLISTVLGNFLVFVILRLALVVLKFSNDSWKMLNIVGVVLGMAFPNVPSSIKERIIVACLLLMCIDYSGDLHSILTDMDMSPIPVKKIDTLEDLAMSGLNIGARYYSMKKLFDDDRKCIKDLADRSYSATDNYTLTNCLRDLHKYKNVSCTTESIYRMTRDYKKKSEKLEVKIIADPMTYFAAVYVLEHGAPFVDNFNTEVLGMIEVGLMSKLDIYESNRRVILKEYQPEVTDWSAQIRQRMFVMLAFGYILGSVAFVGEFLHSYLYTRTLRVRKCQLTKENKQNFFYRGVLSRVMKYKEWKTFKEVGNPCW